jgi:hypothetical protein
MERAKRTFNVRYKEYIEAIRNISSSYGYSDPILNMGHIYRTITDATYITKKANTLEKYHIYKSSKDNLHMNDMYNPIFETLHGNLCQTAAHTPTFPLKAKLNTQNIRNSMHIRFHNNGTSSIGS